MRCYPLPLSRDAHSLMPFDGGFLIADTLNNRVNHERLSPDGSGFVSTEFWRQHPSDKDETHVNSLCSLNDEVYVSSFGEKPGNAWTSCQTGQIINISTGEIVCNNLQHPHTLATCAGYVYWLESKTGLLHRYAPGGKHESLLHLDGYVRRIGVRHRLHLCRRERGQTLLPQLGNGKQIRLRQSRRLLLVDLSHLAKDRSD